MSRLSFSVVKLVFVFAFLCSFLLPFVSCFLCNFKKKKKKKKEEED
jgi:phosphotransferase system  glucose/maltose/N-acetylglucosamine-specific IIC component